MKNVNKLVLRVISPFESYLPIWKLKTMVKKWKLVYYVQKIAIFLGVEYCGKRFYFNGKMSSIIFDTYYTGSLDRVPQN